MKKVLFVIISIFIVLGIVITLSNKGSFSMELDDFSVELNYVEDSSVLKKDVYNFIDLIDDSLFVTSSYSMSSVLNENYDFLVDFAISFILNNEEHYKDKIVEGDKYLYVDGFGNEYVTYKYIDLESVYEITNSVFGKRDYMIFNEHLKEVDGFIPLLLLKDNISFMEIDEISDIIERSNQYEVFVKYKDVDYTYIYIFVNKDRKMNLVNLDVEV